eukprot:UC4_evm13s179
MALLVKTLSDPASRSVPLSSKPGALPPPDIKPLSSRDIKADPKKSTIMTEPRPISASIIRPDAAKESSGTNRKTNTLK